MDLEAAHSISWNFFVKQILRPIQSKH